MVNKELRKTYFYMYARYLPNIWESIRINQVMTWFVQIASPKGSVAAFRLDVLLSQVNCFCLQKRMLSMHILNAGRLANSRWLKLCICPYVHTFHIKQFFEHGMKANRLKLKANCVHVCMIYSQETPLITQCAGNLNLVIHTNHFHLIWIY